MHIPNLLPEKHKKDYKLYMILSYVKRFLIIQIFIAVFFAGAFSAYGWFLERQISDSEEALATLQQTQEKIYLDDVLSLLHEQSDRMEAAGKILQKKPYLNFLLTELIKIIPAGITLDSMDIQTNPSEIAIKGRAQSRDQVVELQEKLEQSEVLQVEYAPLSNFTQAKDANFSFTISYDLEDVLTFKK